MSDNYHQHFEQTVVVGGQPYPVKVRKQTSLLPEAPRLLVVSYLPNQMAAEILRVCIQTVQHFTPEPHELWVVDNHSPEEYKRWLLDEPGVNVVFNEMEPIPAGERRFWHRWRLFQHQQRWGSYANAIGLELGVRLIDPDTRHLVTLHMDTMPCDVSWLPFLRSKLDEKVRAAGVHLQKNRVPEGILHVLGYMVDFQLFRQLNLDFMPCLPQLDVGDRVTVALRQAGYGIFACRDTFTEPDLIAHIPPSPPKEFGVFRALDDENRVIFMHLGRGVRKTTGEHRRGIMAEEWIQFAQSQLLTLPKSNEAV